MTANEFATLEHCSLLLDDGITRASRHPALELAKELADLRADDEAVYQRVVAYLQVEADQAKEATERDRASHAERTKALTDDITEAERDKQADRDQELIDMTDDEAGE